MCGILGYVGRRTFDAEGFGRALDTMAARGPDDRGIYAEPEVLLGHRRLSIIDLSAGGRQPLISGDGRYVVVFNGEIYNYQAIRNELAQRGVIFSSRSDTEVLLASYALKGPACLDEFRGMFALAIYDRKEQSFFLARDRMGIKPLYLWRFPGGIAFASEVTALQALPGGPSQLAATALWNYLSWGSIPEPLTIAEGVESFPPATWAKWTRERETQAVYWHLPTEAPIFTRRDEALEQLRPVLREAVALRCIADVPVGAFLSGGIDSSSIVSLMRAAGQHDLRTFSISSPQAEFDEAPFARTIAEHFETTHVDVPVSDTMVAQQLDGFFASMDQPTVDGLNTYLISAVARRGGLTVALSGVGGDELFAGYPLFRRIARVEPLLSRLPGAALAAAGHAAQRFRGRWKKLEALGSPAALVERLYAAARGVLTPSEAHAVLSADVRGALADAQAASGPQTDGGYEMPDIGGWSPLHRMMFREVRRYMRNQLLRDSDVFAMAHGLEIRVPLIDHVVAELLFRTDPAVILQSPPKSLLLDALPAPLPRVCTRRTKMGFTLPFDRWMKGPWRKMIEDALLAPASGNGAGTVFDRGAVEQMWRRYLAGGMHWSRPWVLYVAVRRLQNAPSMRHERTPAVTLPATAREREVPQGGTLFLLPEVFHSPGGIQMYNRNQVQALKACAPAEPMSVLVLNDSPRDVRQPEWDGCVVRGYSRRKLRFALGAIRQVSRQRPARIVLGHRNFLPVSPLLRLAAPRSEQWLILHGVDAWPAVGRFERGILRTLDRLFAVSPQTAATFHGAGGPADICVWPNAVPFFWQVPALVPPRFDGPLQLLCVARLASPERYKGVEQNIRALRLVLDQGIATVLHIVGDGADRRRLEAIAGGLGVAEHVRFHGRVSDAVLGELYSACDLFVLPSGAEGFGIVFIEAMAYGKPVIAADAAGAPFAVRPGESGFLVPFDDVPALARCIVERAHDPDGSRAAGLRGREFMLRNFSFDCFVDTTRQILRRTAGGAPAPSAELGTVQL